MKFEQHYLDYFLLFGDTFSDVHRWLDEFANKPNIGLKHRKFRHHLAAKRHIDQDLKVKVGKKRIIFQQTKVIM